MFVFLLVGLVGGSLTILAESIRIVLMIGDRGLRLRCAAPDPSRDPGRIWNTAPASWSRSPISPSASACWAARSGSSTRPWGSSREKRSWARHSASRWPPSSARINLAINVVAWDGMRRAAEAESSLVMLAQLKARVVKLVSSLFVIVTMSVAALSTDRVVVAWADVIGSSFVAVFIFINAIDMLKLGLPDLLDRTAGKQVRDFGRACARQPGGRLRAPPSPALAALRAGRLHRARARLRAGPDHRRGESPHRGVEGIAEPRDRPCRCLGSRLAWGRLASPAADALPRRTWPLSLHRSPPYQLRNMPISPRRPSG